jgi:hypothetical protein
VTTDPATTIVPPPDPAAPAAPAPRRADCPACAQPLVIDENGRAACPICRFRGQAYFFNPLPFTVETAERALPEDATCLHHPTKKAVAVCAGTGDYICALCAIEVQGQTYSAAYLSGAGKDKIGTSFQRYLERPDARVATLLFLCFVPYINVIVLFFAFIWIPYAFYLYVKACRMRKKDPLYARVFGTTRMIVLPILLSLFALGWIIVAILIVFGVVTRRL